MTISTNEWESDSPYREYPCRHYVGTQASYSILCRHIFSLSVERPRWIGHLQRHVLFIVCLLTSVVLDGLCFDCRSRQKLSKQSLSTPQHLKTLICIVSDVKAIAGTEPSLSSLPFIQLLLRLQMYSTKLFLCLSR